MERADTTDSNGTPHHKAAAAAARGVGDLLHPVQGELDLTPAPRRRELEARSQLGVEHHVVRSHVGTNRHRVAQHGARAERRHTGHAGIVEVQDGDSRGGQRRHQFALRPRHTLEITEVLRVGLGNTGDDPDVGPGHFGQARDVPETAGAHLENDPPDIDGCVEQRQRKAELVVEGPLAGRRAEGRHQALVHEILGGRLADRSGDPDDSGVETLARQQAQVHQRDAGVGDGDGRRPDRLPRGQVGGRTGVEGGPDEVVPVPLRDDRDIELSRQRRPGVDARSLDGDIGAGQLPAEHGCELRCDESHASSSQSIV